MAWLRSKKRTIDLGKDIDVKCTDKKTSMDNGEYRYQPVENRPTPSNNNGNNNSSSNSNDNSNNSNNNSNNSNKNSLDSNFMNGIISTSPCVVDTNNSKFFQNEDVSNGEFMTIYDDDNIVNNDDKINNDGKTDDKNGKDSVDNEINGENSDTSINCDGKVEVKETNNLRKLSDISIGDSDSTLPSLSPTHNHSIDDSITLSFPNSDNEDDHHTYNKYKDDNEKICEEDQEEHDEERRDSFAEYTLNLKNKQNFNKPRHSLDSQIALLPLQLKSSLKVNSFDSLNESEEEDYYGEMKPISKKKSISWASDLETIHEFEKIKGRRLSLSSLFKKL